MTRLCRIGKLAPLLYGSMIIAGKLFAAGPSLAAPPQNADPALAPWFQSLKAPNGTGCCSVADCRRAESRLSTAGYEVMIGDRWHAVPWERVLRRTDNPTGQAIVCYVPDTELILCFVRPPEA
jgi:hypothetical protein